jgi:hypothetical protein
MTITEIQRGTPISADMVIAKQIPSDEAFTHALHNFNEATGRIAQVDIRAGSILLRDMMRDRPITPQGFSLISVRLMSGTDDITVGDTLNVMTITPCPNQQGSGLLNPVQPNSERPDSDLSQLDQDQERHENITDAQVCLLTDKAIAMNTAATQETEAQSSIISLAMPPDDAARVLMAQEGADLIAVIQ